MCKLFHKHKLHEHEQSWFHANAVKAKAIAAVTKCTGVICAVGTSLLEASSSKATLKHRLLQAISGHYDSTATKWYESSFPPK